MRSPTPEPSAHEHGNTRDAESGGRVWKRPRERRTHTRVGCVPLDPHGIECEYRTAEHAYHAHKATTLPDHNVVATAPSALLARQRGNRITLRSGWDTARYEAMLTVLCAQHPYARTELLDTTDVALLVMEAGEWGASDGQNLLGRALMRVRTELQTHTTS